MISFATSQTKGALFQNWIAAVPERERETDHLMAIANSGEPVFIPPKGARPGVVVWQVVPCRAVRAVVFPHGAPRALTEVWPPALPMCFPVARLFKPLLFGGQFP